MTDIILADDHRVVREGIKRMLIDSDDLRVVGEADDGESLLGLLRSTSCDVVLLDLSMPGGHSINLIPQLKVKYPEIKILVFSMHEERQYAVRCLKAGAAGYLTKDSAPTELVQAIRKVSRGGLSYTPAVTEQLAQQVVKPDASAPHQSLSNREYQVFELLVQGQGVTAVADMLNLSVKTVSTHKTHILEKLALKNQSELIRYALAHNLTS